MHYESPGTCERAVVLLAEAAGAAHPLAGGTDLLVQLRSGMVEPELVVNLNCIPSLKTIQRENGGIRIGAAVPSARLGEHEELRSQWPGVVEAMGLVGSTQIQERATLAGNICNASPAADSVPAMIAAEAKATIAGPEGNREIPVAEVAIGPGQTSLARGEIIESIYLPVRPERSGDAYLRFIPRTEMDIAVVGVGVSLTLDGDGKCSAARVSLGAVAATVLLVEEAGEALIGTFLDEGALHNLSEACSAACRPIDDKRGTVAFRTRVAGVLAKRAAKIAFDRARGIS